jgi:hypothetical protein
VVRADRLDDALPADRNDTFTEHLVGCGGCAEYTRRIGRRIRALAEAGPTTNGAPMLLNNKTAIVYGAAGAIGSAIARAYAREGADVHLAGRTQGTLEQVAQRIRADGGAAHVTHLDVLD